MTQKAEAQATVAKTTPVVNTVKLVTECVLPGSSLLIEGRIKEGAVHAVAGFAGRALLGPVGWFLAAANSYSNSVTHQNLHKNLVNDPSS